MYPHRVMTKCNTAKQSTKCCSN